MPTKGKNKYKMNPIRVRLMGSEDDEFAELVFLIRMNSTFESIMLEYSEETGKPEEYLLFEFDGEEVQPDDTPAKLKMEDGDLIEVYYSSNTDKTFRL